MLKACIEKIATGESCWIPIPNGDLSSAISDFAGDRDWECVLITGMKENGHTLFPLNSFHKCDLFEFNNMLFQANDFKYTEENLAILNLFLEDRHYDCDEIINLYENGNFYIYHNAENMSDVAMEIIKDERYGEIPEFIKEHIDYESYGEFLESSGNWLQDKNYKIIIEVFE